MTSKLLLLVLGAAAAIVAYRVQVHDLQSEPARAVASVAVGLSFLAAGLVAWTRRPRNRLGPIMVAAGFALLVRQFRYSDDAVAFTVFFAAGELAYALFAHAALAYPSGRVSDRLERAFLAAAYATVVVFPFATLLVYDRSAALRFVRFPRESLLAIHGDRALAELVEKTFVVVAYGVLASLFVLLLLRKLLRASPRGRRILAPLLVAAAVAALRAVFESALMFWTPPPSFVVDNLYWWQIGGLLAMPAALLAGLLRSRLARASVADLVVRLGRAPPANVRDELARTLEDPSLAVAYRVDGGYVDELGRPVVLPPDGPERAVAVLEDGDEPLAALVFDPALRDEPPLVDAVAAAARLALANARLHAEVNAQLLEVKASRARIAAAADEERRRIERDLHDGAQQRLVALALELRAARTRLGAEATVTRLLDAAGEELQAAVSELRELARGIHPAILTEGGLAAALDAVAAKATVPVDVEAVQERLAPGVEAAAYFVVTEALANVAKHARATRATVVATREGGNLVVTVDDDGVGGADATAGTGLRGLADRVEALGGRLMVDSRPGRGTRVVVEIPCGS